MNPVLSRVTGTRDHVEREAIAFRQLRDAVEQTFARYAYLPVAPPILEHAAPFLNRSGEEIRRRMYVFADPAGREVCLRPELTIPVCRLFLRDGDPRGQTARLSYVGPAFRYEPPAEGRYREFNQAGIELFGTAQAEAADAEVVAVALDALAACGLGDLEVVLGDLDLVSSFIQGLPIADRWKKKLVRATRSQASIDARALAATDEPSESSAELLGLLASIGPEKAHVVVSEVLALADVRHVGGRTPEEIAERLLSRAADGEVSGISAEILEGLARLLAIRLPIVGALEAVREAARPFGVDLEPALARCQGRLEILGAYGHDPADFVLDVGLRRGLAYYTGFVFEVLSRQRPELGHLCGGGRYDDLLEELGAPGPVPAAGFALGLDRIMAARALRDGAAVAGARPDALLAAADGVRAEDCVRVATALRAAGWSVEVDLSSRRPAAIQHVLRRDVPYIAFVDAEELASRRVRIKRLADRTETLVELDELEVYAQRERERWFAPYEEMADVDETPAAVEETLAAVEETLAAVEETLAAVDELAAESRKD